MRSSMRSKFIDTIRHFFTGDQPAYSAIDIFQLGSGIFGLAAFRGHIDRIPTDPAQIQAHVQALSKQPADDQAIYAYLVLQAAAFGSKPIWVEGGRWQNCTFRGYWLPRPDTSRQSPVNPMMPMPETLYARMAALVTGMKGVRARQADVTTYEPEPETAVYIDPPYVNTTRYGHAFDVATLAKSLAGKGLPVFVSEARPLSNQATLLASAAQRKKGGISGVRASPNEEWLSEFR